MFDQIKGEVVGEGRPTDGEDELRIYLIVPRDVGGKMSKAKFAVQAMHAAVAVYELCRLSDPERALQYMQVSQAKIVLEVNTEVELRDLHTRARSGGFSAVLITDAGRTEFEAPTTTAVCIGPIWWRAESSQLLGHLPLYRGR